MDSSLSSARPPLMGGTAWRRFCRDRTSVLAGVILISLTLLTLLGPWLYSASPTQIDFGQALRAPSISHPFGTNDLGQDMLARLLVGGRISLAIGVTAMAVAMSLGILVGAIAGFYRWLDGPLMRLTDLCLALPQLPLTLLIIYLFGEPIRSALGAELGMFCLIVSVIGSLNWMSVARLVRAGFLSVRERTFVQAAIALGAPPHRLIWHHILPNVLSPVVVAATIAVGNAIIAESTLSFLGLGFPPDTPTWGRLLYDAQNYIETAPYMVLFPGLAIFLTVLSINYVGEGLRNALDPQGR